jgi:hypothetical protein
MYSTIYREACQEAAEPQEYLRLGSIQLHKRFL